MLRMRLGRRLGSLATLGLSVIALAWAEPSRGPAPRTPALILPPPFANGPLLPRPLVMTGATPVDIVVADWNADGILDVALPGRGISSGPVSQRTDGEVTPLLGSRDGRFQRLPGPEPVTAPSGGAAADFNGDSKADLAVIQGNGARLTVFPGNGAGGFGAPVVTLLEQAAHTLVAGNLDGDAGPDLILVHGDPDAIGVLLGLGDGTFDDETLVPTCPSPADLALGDFDADGDADVAVACYLSGIVQVHFNDGTGGFGPGTVVADGRPFSSVVAGDFQGDGLLDLAASGPSYLGVETEVGVILIPGNGPGGFDAAIPVASDRGTRDLRSADMNGDGIFDLLGIFVEEYPYTTPEEIRVYLGTPGGLPALVQTHKGGISAGQLAVGDFNGDGPIDVAVGYRGHSFIGEEEFETLFGQGDGHLAVERCFAPGGQYVGLSHADLNHDGLIDFVGLDLGERDGPEGALHVLLATSDGGFSETSHPLPGGEYGGLVLGDFNADGEIDAAVAYSSFTWLEGGGVQFYRGRGDGSLTPTENLPLSGGVLAIASGNFDGDPYPDLAVLLACFDTLCVTGRVSIFIGTSFGGFFGPVDSNPGWQPHTLETGDFDADGIDEIALNQNFGLAGQSNLFRVSDYRLTEGRSLASGGMNISVGDLNGDSIDDLLLGTIVYLGAPGIGPGTPHPGPSLDSRMVIADMNLDGQADLIGSTRGLVHIGASLADGQGGYSSVEAFLLTRELRNFARLPLDASDFDRDGRVDLAFAGTSICIAPNLFGTPDADQDGIVDSTDPCIDPDQDGYADRVTPHSACPPDNCAGDPNSAQADSDGDSRGDACDPCPFDALDDLDHDGVCGAVDHCPAIKDDSNIDSDGDAAGDACDVCPITPDPAQADSNGDGSGDACQPNVAIQSMQRDENGDLEVVATVSDPQDDLLSLYASINGPARGWTVPNVLTATGDFCDPQYSILPPEFAGMGRIVFAAGFGIGPRIADGDLALGCGAEEPNFLMNAGTCTGISWSSQEVFLDVLPLPATICITQYPSYEPLLTLSILGWDESSIHVARTATEGLVFWGMQEYLAGTMSLTGLTIGQTYTLEIEANDRNTEPFRTSRDFVYEGEPVMTLVSDSDDDGILDDEDPCVDPDGDGFGVPEYSGTCPVDNCPATANAGQDDFDADGEGDACDGCTDSDDDGYGDPGFPNIFCDLDNCPAVANPYPEDADEDLVGDVCDNCPSIVNSDQADTNADGSGDACQPRVTVSSVTPDGRGALVARGSAHEPQNETLYGHLRVLASTGASGGAHAVALTRQRPGLSNSERWTRAEALIDISFAGEIPAEFPLTGLAAGLSYLFEIEVTDANTVPANASAGFVYHGEAKMVVQLNNAPPLAAIAAAPSTECTGDDGALVTLDGSGSTDPDSSPGTSDDIEAYDWFEDYGTAGERSLGSGAVLQTRLGLGSHAVTLSVTDQAGESSNATTTVTVVDTVPPVIDCVESVPSAECSGAGGAYVEVSATAHDVCGGSVTLTNDHTGGGADASGPYPLGATSVVFTAADGRGHSATCTSSVSVVDTQQPTLSLYTDPGTLWPPNHEMVPVGVRFAAQDVCGTGIRVELVSVVSSEPDDTQGGDDGQTTDDIQNVEIGTADASIDLRAERAGKSIGRTYTLTYRAIDMGGHATDAVGVVTVPHDLGQGPEPVLMRIERPGPGSEVRVFWPAVSEATSYDLIRGDLASLRADGGVLHLGNVAVLARSTTATSAIEPAAGDGATPPVGGGWFYLIQQVTDRGAVGYGTESAPWPRVPDACDGGCPGMGEAVATTPTGSPSGGSGTRKR